MRTELLNLFVDAVKHWMEVEGKTKEEIIQRYTKLTTLEKEEILKAII